MLRIALCFILLCSSGVALSCGCSKPEYPKQVKHYAHIFEGEVVSVESRDVASKYGSFDEVIVEFKVRKRIAGPSKKRLKSVLAALHLATLKKQNLPLVKIG